MIKKLALLISLLIFSSNLIAEEIIMKCKYYLYKFEANSSGVSIYASNIKRDKKKYHKFCPAKVRADNKHFLISSEGAETIITDYKVTCLTAKGVLKTGVVTNSTSVTDFKKLTRNSEYYWNGKKMTQSEKCKRVRK